MGWLDAFRSSEKKGSAQLAKERLQVVVAHRRSGRDGEQPAYFPKLQQDLLAVLRKYVRVTDDAVQMDIEREGDLDVLELNITLPDAKELEQKQENLKQDQGGNRHKSGRKSRRSRSKR